MRIALISDTHGWLDPRIHELFADVAAILHAGDIGVFGVVEQLRQIAPLQVVRGNVDRTPDLLALPEHVDLMLGGVRLHLVHRPVDARPRDAQIVVYGHTHKPLVDWRDGVCWVNPGAAGRRGFHTERSVAVLELDAWPPRIEIIPLGPRSARALP